MRNTTKFFGIIALAAVIIFSMASCGDGGGGGGLLTVNSTNRSLSITGLDSYNGYWVIVDGDSASHEYHASANVSSAGIITGALISGGTATLQLWRVHENARITFSGFSGGDSDVYLSISIIDNAREDRGDIVSEGWIQVDFASTPIAATIAETDISWD